VRSRLRVWLAVGGHPRAARRELRQPVVRRGPPADLVEMLGQGRPRSLAVGAGLPGTAERRGQGVGEVGRHQRRPLRQEVGGYGAVQPRQEPRRLRDLVGGRQRAAAGGAVVPGSGAECAAGDQCGQPALARRHRGEHELETLAGECRRAGVRPLEGVVRVPRAESVECREQDRPAAGLHPPVVGAEPEGEVFGVVGVGCPEPAYQLQELRVAEVGGWFAHSVPLVDALGEAGGVDAYQPAASSVRFPVPRSAALATPHNPNP